MTEATEPATGIAGTADQAKPAAGTCHACGGPSEIPHTVYAMPGVGVIVACSSKCAADVKFPPSEAAFVNRVIQDRRHFLRDELAQLDLTLVNGYSPHLMKTAAPNAYATIRMHLLKRLEQLETEK